MEASHQGHTASCTRGVPCPASLGINLRAGRNGEGRDGESTHTLNQITHAQHHDTRVTREASWGLGEAITRPTAGGGGEVQVRTGRLGGCNDTCNC